MRGVSFIVKRSCDVGQHMTIDEVSRRDKVRRTQPYVVVARESPAFALCGEELVPIKPSPELLLGIERPSVLIDPVPVPEPSHLRGCLAPICRD